MLFERLQTAWRRLWGSVSFRLTLNYSILAVATTAFLLIFAYGKIVELLQAQFSRQVTLAANRLAAHHETAGLDALRIEVEELLSDQTDIDSEIYLLATPEGLRITGNLDLIPARGSGDVRPAIALPQEDDAALLLLQEGSPPVILKVLREGKPVTGLLTMRNLGEDGRLYVGRDIADMKDIQTLIGKAVLAATGVALFLVLVGTTIFRRELRQRVQAIRDTAMRVGTGELTNRIPEPNESDEFAQLRNDINDMLDRIETLMNGVRNVSDSLAHNLRTPLARALAHLDKARHHDHDPARRAAAIDAASSELHALIQVSEKLLLIAEAESGLQRQSFMTISLSGLVGDILELYEPVASEQGLQLEGHLMPVRVKADPDLLASALTNLLDNAFKYAGDGVRIDITLTQQEGMARIRVRDRGPGVSDEHLPQLGNRFFRLEPDIPGFGLGLASVRAVVDLHGGTIAFRNAHPGLTVEICLPAHSA